MSARDRAPRRLRWALHAYPRGVRSSEGDMLLSLARDIADEGGSSMNREALSLLRGGLAARAGAVARAPWEPALRRAALGIAGAILALVCGAAAGWLREPAWPGWSWIAALAAPALVVAGHLAGRRALVAGGALLLIASGVAQANSLAPALFSLQGSIEWGLRGGGRGAGSARSVDLPLLACALPGAVVMLASAAHARRPVPATVAWLAAGAAGVAVAVDRIAASDPASTVTLGGIRLNALGSCMVAAVLAAMAAFAFGFARRRRDPAGMLAGVLVVTPVLPVVVLYGLAGLPLGDGQAYLALAAAAVAMAVGFVAIVRRIGTEPSRA